VPLGCTADTTLNDAVQPSSTVDPNWNTSQFSYDNNGNLISSTDPVGAQTTSTYASITNGSAFAAGLLASQSETRPDLPYTVFTTNSYYSNPGLASNYVGELASVTQEALDSSNNPGSVVTVSLYQYDANGNRTIQTQTGTVNGSPGQTNTTRMIYDAQNRVIQTIDALGRTNSTTYNKLGKQATNTDAWGRTTIYTYDALGNLIETLYANGSVTRATYNEKSQVVYSQDRAVPDGNNQTIAPATMNLYDINGNLVCGQRLSQVALARQTATNGTDYAGLSGGDTQYKMVVNSSGTFASCTRTVYDLDGRVQYAMDARGTVTEYDYDADGRRTNMLVYLNYTVSPPATGTIAPTGAVMTTSFAYDGNGNQTAQVDALGRTNSYVFDPANRLVQTIFPPVAGDAGSKTTSTAYDALGRKIGQIDEAGVVTTYAYDFRGLLTSVTLDAANTNSLTTSYSYDEAGNEITQIDANNHTNAFRYDVLGRRTSRILPDGSIETTVYNDVPATNGVKVQQTIVTNFMGKAIVSTDDILDRLQTKILPAVNSGETQTTNTYGYSVDGQLAQVVSSGNVQRTNYYAFDTLRRLVQKDAPEGVVAYAYTPASDVQTIMGYRRCAVPVGGSIPTNAIPDVSLGYGYDTLGRLQYVTNSAISAPNVTTYAYDGVGNLDHFTYPNGVTHAYSYTEQNRLLYMGVTNSAGALLRGYAYQLNPVGYRTAVAEGTNAYGGAPRVRRQVAYQYDGPAVPSVYRLTQETLFDSASNVIGTILHAYDSVGNRFSRTTNNFAFVPSDPSLTNQSLSFDNRDQILSPITGTPVGDLNGNTTTNELGVATGDQYDAENHLTKRGSTIRVGYDHEGNRVSKTANGTNTYYLVDDRNPSGYVQVLAEYSSVSSNVAPNVTYAYGLELISQQQGSGSVHYYCFDGQGSVRALTDSTAALTDFYDYEGYGMLLAAGGSTPNNYLYTGQQWDPDLGMYYQRARYFNPQIGRFWSRDPYEGDEEDPLTLHKYLYCQANPVNCIDPTGLETYLVLYGEGGGPDFGVDDAAKTRADQLTADIQARHREGVDKVVLLKTTTFDAVQSALKQNKEIRAIHIFTHGAPKFISLGYNINADGGNGNISRDGGIVKWYIDWRQSGFPWIWPQYLQVSTRSWKDLDKANCIQGGQLFIRGCNTDYVARGMGLYLFGNRGSGASDYTHPVRRGKKTFLLTGWEEGFLNFSEFVFGL